MKYYKFLGLIALTTLAAACGDSGGKKTGLSANTLTTSPRGKFEGEEVVNLMDEDRKDKALQKIHRKLSESCTERAKAIASADAASVSVPEASTPSPQPIPTPQQIIGSPGNKVVQEVVFEYLAPAYPLMAAQIRTQSRVDDKGRYFINENAIAAFGFPKLSAGDNYDISMDDWYRNYDPEDVTAKSREALSIKEKFPARQIEKIEKEGNLGFECEILPSNKAKTSTAVRGTYQFPDSDLKVPAIMIETKTTGMVTNCRNVEDQEKYGGKAVNLYSSKITTNGSFDWTSQFVCGSRDIFSVTVSSQSGSPLFFEKTEVVKHQRN